MKVPLFPLLICMAAIWSSACNPSPEAHEATAGEIRILAGQVGSFEFDLEQATEPGKAELAAENLRESKRKLADLKRRSVPGISEAEFDQHADTYRTASFADLGRALEERMREENKRQAESAARAAEIHRATAQEQRKNELEDMMREAHRGTRVARSELQIALIGAGDSAGSAKVKRQQDDADEELRAQISELRNRKSE